MTQPHSPADDPDVVARRQAVAHEYGQYVATQDIYVGNALAYRVGDPVPVSNVERHGYLANELVAKTSTKAGKAAADAAGGETSAKGGRA